MSTLNESDTSSRLGYATVLGVNGNIVRVKVVSGTMIKNEVAYVCVGEERLKSEVLRIYGDIADLQVFEETHGIRYGDRVELSGELLSVSLGPGMLGVIYDGLQNPLTLLAEQDGFFLQRGRDVESLDSSREWQFTPACKPGDRVVAGQTLGTVTEKNIEHKIMAPFELRTAMNVDSIASGLVTTESVAATLVDRSGKKREVKVAQTWPVRQPLAASMQRQRLITREFPSEPLITTTRVIDTFFPSPAAAPPASPARSEPAKRCCRACWHATQPSTW